MIEVFKRVAFLSVVLWGLKTECCLNVLCYIALK